MFSFLNSTVLLAAAAALIPLIIHLFSRRRVKIVEFSSIRHLKAMQRRQVRRLKIRQLLLLILRMLIILAVVLAFARPTLRTGGVGAHATVSAVILFDNSASMDRVVADGNLYELAKRRTAALLETFGQDDEVCLVPLDPTTRQGSALEFSSAAVAGQVLEALPVGHSRADLQGALESARRLLDRAVNLNRELYLVSDLQRINLPDEPLAFDDNIRFCVVAVPVDQPDNRGVVAVDFGGQLIQVGHEFRLTATIRNYSPQPDSQLIASLFLDGARVAQTEFAVGGGDETAVHFARSVATTGFHSGFVEISDDRFPGDNRYYFSFAIPNRIAVLLVDGDEAAAYIRLALAPDEATGRYWSVKTAVPRELSGVSFSDYDAVILAGIPKLNASHVSRLKAYVRRGGAVLLTYGMNTDIGYVNDTWGEITGVMFDRPARRDFTRAGFYTLVSVATEHPVFSVYSFKDDRPPDIKFYTLPDVRLAGSPSVLMRFSGNRPALVESRFGRGRVLTMTGPVAAPYSELVTHSFFVPLMSRLVEYLAADLSALDTRVFCGENVIRPVNAVGAMKRPVVLVAPDSTRWELTPQEERGALVVKISPAAQVGVYSLRFRGREIDRFAVNLPAAEGDLTAADPDRLVAAAGLPSYHLLGLEEGPMTVLPQLRLGRELWPLFLWLAVLLLVAEMLLARGAPAED